MDICAVCMYGNPYPFIYLSLETGEMIAGQPFIFVLCFIQWRICLERDLHVSYFQNH